MSKSQLCIFLVLGAVFTFASPSQSFAVSCSKSLVGFHFVVDLHDVTYDSEKASLNLELKVPIQIFNPETSKHEIVFHSFFFSHLDTSDLSFSGVSDQGGLTVSGQVHFDADNRFSHVNILALHQVDGKQIAAASQYLESAYPDVSRELLSDRPHGMIMEFFRRGYNPECQDDRNYAVKYWRRALWVHLRTSIPIFSFSENGNLKVKPQRLNNTFFVGFADEWGFADYESNIQYFSEQYSANKNVRIGKALSRLSIITNLSHGHRSYKQQTIKLFFHFRGEDPVSPWAAMAFHDYL